jgi:hypothetical protein
VFLSEFTLGGRETNYELLLGNARVLVGFLVSRLDLILFIHDADEEGYLPANAIASTAPTKEICLRGDHKRGIRRATNQTPAGCRYKIEISLGP